MSFVLSLLACLITDPGYCKRYEVQVEACNAGGIGQLAAWAIKHPEYQVTKWHCGEGTET